MRSTVRSCTGDATGAGWREWPRQFYWETAMRHVCVVMAVGACASATLAGPVNIINGAYEVNANWEVVDSAAFDGDFSSSVEDGIGSFASVEGNSDGFSALARYDEGPLGGGGVAYVVANFSTEFTVSTDSVATVTWDFSGEYGPAGGASSFLQILNFDDGSGGGAGGGGGIFNATGISGLATLALSAGESIFIFSEAVHLGEYPGLDSTFSVEVTPAEVIPLPSAAALGGFGLLAIGTRRRRGV